jgi:GNAT superfamily N-acetyltransferase
MAADLSVAAIGFHTAELRAVVAKDWDFLLGLYATTRAAELELVRWSAAEKAVFCEMQFRAQEAHYAGHYPEAVRCVVAVDGVPAGRLYWEVWEAEIRIIDLALMPEFCGRGIGTALLKELMLQRRKLSLHVECFSRARGLYERLGFKIAEDKGVYLLMEWLAGSEANC